MCMVAFSRRQEYSALKKVSAHKGDPTWAYIVITDACSHKCAWCYGGFNEALSGNMSIDLYRTILAKLGELGVVQVTLAGGEPTEHPQFREFVREACAAGFIVHLATHGEHIDDELVSYLKQCGVHQIQFNYQGSKYHDSIHGIAGSYRKQIVGMKLDLNAGIEVTANVTIGKYNVENLEEIFDEAHKLGCDRIRIWESTGRGKPWLKEYSPKQIFERAEIAARSIGYDHSLSYDPEYSGSVNVPCLQFSNVFLYITHDGFLRFCGAVPGGNELLIADFSQEPAAVILEKYKVYNKQRQGAAKCWCPARYGFRQDDVALKEQRGAALRSKFEQKSSVDAG